MSDGPVRCRLDIVPALLAVSGSDHEPEEYPQTRVVITADRIYAWADGPPGEGPVLVLDSRLDAIAGRNTTGWTVTLSDGREAFVKRGQGCACGSRLRGFRPFPQGLVQMAWLPQ